MSSLWITLPSSALTFIAESLVITNSLPSPSMWLYTPSSNAFSKVDLPWYPPPTIKVIPLGIPIPLISPELGVLKLTSNSFGEINLIPFLRGFEDIPLSLGSIESFPIKATNPCSSKLCLIYCWSSTNSTLFFKASLLRLL